MTNGKLDWRTEQAPEYPLEDKDSNQMFRGMFVRLYNVCNASVFLERLLRKLTEKLTVDMHCHKYPVAGSPWDSVWWAAIHAKIYEETSLSNGVKDGRYGVIIIMVVGGNMKMLHHQEKGKQKRTEHRALWGSSFRSIWGTCLASPSHLTWCKLLHVLFVWKHLYTYCYFF